MTIKYTPPWPIENDDDKENYTARFDLTGVDASTGRIETFKNASFSYGIITHSPMWTIAGHSADHALSEIHSYVKTHNYVKTSIR